MPRSESQRKNTSKKYRKIQAQFTERMAERTASNAAPSFASVVKTLADDWCMSTDSIEEILRKEV